ncbi:MAG TPA: hypothetical protein VMT79_05115 [Candidatus Binatia bacterium]|nr:hypothetical protein [Candidatus Binatia bacterium]
MRHLALGIVVALLLGCAPGSREAAQQAWEARDLERARECMDSGGQWVVGSCSYGRAF